MTGLLVKLLLLLILLLWSAQKALRWASRMQGPYGRLAADFSRLLDEFGRGLSRTIFWGLVVLLIVLVTRGALTRWWKEREEPPKDRVEEARPFAESPLSKA